LGLTAGLKVHFGPSFLSPGFTGGFTTPTWLGYNTEISPYVVSYVANTGTGTPSETTQNYLADALTLPTVGTMVKAGYAFQGWSTSSGDANGEGATVLVGVYTPTAAVTLYAVWALAFETAPTPTITGTTTVGSTLTAVTGTWSPVADSFSYVWNRDETVIPDATASTYVLQDADAGKAISVTVTGIKTGYASSSQRSAVPVVPTRPLPAPSDQLLAMTCLDGGANGGSIDVATGAGEGLATQALTGDCFIGGDYDAKAGVTYVINGYETSLLQSMNTNTGALTTIHHTWIGDVSTVHPITSLTINAAGEGYAIDSLMDLYRLNLATAELTFIGGTGLDDPYNYDFNPVDGLLYHIDPLLSGVFTVDPATGFSTMVGSAPSDVLDGLQIDSNGVAWYLFEGSLYSSSDLTALAAHEVYQGEITIDSLIPAAVYTLIFVPGPTLPAPTDKLLAMTCSGTGANGGSIDVITGLAVGLATLRADGDCFIGGDYDATTGTTYVLNGTSVPLLQSIDVATGALATIGYPWEGSTSTYRNVRTIAINGAGEAYAVVDNAGDIDLYRISLVTGELTFVANTIFDDALSFDFNPLDGLLYHVAASQHAVVTVDLSTGFPSVVADDLLFDPLDSFQIDANGVAWILFDGTLVSSSDLSALVTTSLLHGVITIDAGSPVVSSLLYVPVFVPSTFVTTPVPTITGTPAVGQMLTADVGTWSPTPGSFTYVWKRGGTPIINATSSTYTVKSGDFGQTITVTVTAVKVGYTSSVQTSSATETVLAGPFVVAPLPTISGTMTAGQRLSVVPGTWSPSAAFSYVWKRDTAVISGATKNNYVLGASDIGKKITVEVRGSRTGFITVTRESLETTAVVGAAFVTSPTPTLSGTLAVGQRLTTVVGTWSPSATLTYVWKRDTDVIGGATKSSYVLTAADRGKKITVIVSGAKAGYATTEKASAQSIAVLGMAFVSAPTPTITGTAKVGQKLGVDRGTWSPSASIAFVWKRNGEIIPGAVNSTYRVTVADLGAKITAELTGSRSGYGSTARESAETATVTR
jgi:uncharacterized repeat protein (TIGR02543 family)